MGLEIFLNAFHEDHWHDFVATCSKDVDEDSIELGDISVPKDISIVLYWRLRNHAYNWLSKPVPALDHATPIELLKSEDGKKILKVALMRMPD